MANATLVLSKVMRCQIYLASHNLLSRSGESLELFRGFAVDHKFRELFRKLLSRFRIDLAAQSLRTRRSI